MKEKRDCACCGKDISWRHGLAKWCLDCQSSSKRFHIVGQSTSRANRIPGAEQAHRAVYHAIKNGRLPRPDALNCVDCGKLAAAYDHRDYNKPLDVQPVCRSCNSYRGPAKALITATETEIERLKLELARLEGKAA